MGDYPQLYHGKNKLLFDAMLMVTMSALYLLKNVRIPKIFSNGLNPMSYDTQMFGLETFMYSVSTWVIVVKRQVNNFSAISWWKQAKFKWDYNDICSLLDQYTYFGLYCVSSVKQQIIRIPSHLLYVFLLLNSACVVEKQ